MGVIFSYDIHSQFKFHEFRKIAPSAVADASGIVMDGVGAGAAQITLELTQ